MKRISIATEIDELYEYPPRRSTANFKDRVRCLISLCDIVERVHDAGQSIGDFNPNNIKILDDWSVCLVDADSYQFSNGGEEYRCVVGAPGYVAPELIRACAGKTYAECETATFSRETDRFALAIHIFRMLFNGHHPFLQGRTLNREGSTPAPSSIDRLVERGHSLFFKPSRNKAIPASAPPIEMLPEYMRDLFYRAFVVGHSDPTARPLPGEWKSALIRYNSELVACWDDQLHFYWNGNVSCPYCDADEREALSNGQQVRERHRIQKHNTCKTRILEPIREQERSRLKVSAFKTAVLRENLLWKNEFERSTVLSTVVIQLLISLIILPAIWPKNYPLVYAIIGAVGSLVSSIVGALIYDRQWGSTQWKFGRHEWWEYFLSVGSAIGFSALFWIVWIASCAILGGNLFLLLCVALVVVGMCSM